MQLLPTFLQIILVTFLMITAALQIWAVSLDYENKSPVGTKVLFRALVCSLLAPMFWFALIALKKGLSPAIILGVFVIITGWCLAYPLIRLNQNVAKGLIPMLFLAGVACALQSDIGSVGAWGKRQGLGMLIGVSFILLAFICVKRFSQTWKDLWTDFGVRCSLLIGGGALFFTVMCFFISRLRNQNPTWFLALFAFLLAISIVAARIASSVAVPSTLWEYYLHWRAVLPFTVLPMLLCFLPKLAGGKADIAPALAMSFALFLIFIFLHQPKAAVILGALAFSIALLVLSFLPDSRPALRVQNWQNPSAAASSQQIKASQAVARGGTIGKVAGWVSTTKHLSDTPLATTDGVWALIGETTGIIGFLAILLSCGAIMVWLAKSALHLKDLRGRTWLAGVLALFIVTVSATAGWPVSAGPIIGYAAPILAGGYSNAGLWGLLLSISVAWHFADSEDTPVRFTVPQNWLSRRPLAIFINSLIVVSLLWVAFCDVRTGNLQRRTVLESVYLGIPSEREAEEMILLGWVTAHEGHISVKEDLIRGDLKYASKKHLAKTIKRAQSAVRLHNFNANGDTVNVVRSSFVESERSGLGALLRNQMNGVDSNGK